MKSQLKKNREVLLDQLHTIQDGKVIIKNAIAFSKLTPFKFQDLIKIVHPKNYSEGQLKTQLVMAFNAIGKATNHETMSFLNQVLAQLEQFETSARKLYTRNLAGEIVETTLPMSATRTRRTHKAPVAKRRRHVDHKSTNVYVSAINKVHLTNCVAYNFIIRPAGRDNVDFPGGRSYQISGYWNFKYNPQLESQLDALMNKVNGSISALYAKMNYRVNTKSKLVLESIFENQD